MFSNTVTVYNAVESGYETIYIPKVLENVELQINNAAVSSKTSQNSENKATLFIKPRSDYLPPKVWRESENKTDFFTLDIGDFFVEGAVNSDYQEIKKSGENVYKITGIMPVISSNLSHWEVVGA
ncbi:MAG: hypothetical protein ACI4JM_05210 [Oscillospiraceae bacterium]